MTASIDIHSVDAARPDPLAAGRWLGRRQLTVDSDMVARQLGGIGLAATLPDPVAGAQADPARCPPSALFYEVMEFPGPRDHEQGRAAFNSGIEWKLCGSLYVGQKLLLEARVRDRWLKRGREYAVFELTVQDEKGRCLGIGGFKESWDRPPPYMPALETRDGAKSEWWVPPRGRELGRFACLFTEEMARSFAGDLVNLHTDLAAARQRGFQALVIAGPQIVAQISELMTRLFGAGYLEAGELKINLLRPVFAGDTLTAHAAIIAGDVIETVGAVLEVALWSSNQKGEVVAGGRGSARLVATIPAEVAEHPPLRQKAAKEQKS